MPTGSPQLTTTVVLMGVSGSGKTTVAVELERMLGWVRLEGDDLMPPENVAKMASGRPLTDEDRRPWLRAVAAWIGEQEEQGRDALVTCSSLRRTYRDLLRDGHASVRFCELDLPPGELARRLGARTGHFMPASLLASQLATLEPLAPDEPGVRVPELGGPAAVAAAVVLALGLERTAG